jgi:hypothetical protein
MQAALGAATLAAACTIAPVEMPDTSEASLSPPNCMIEPLPNCFSICASAASNAFAFSGEPALRAFSSMTNPLGGNQ